MLRKTNSLQYNGDSTCLPMKPRRNRGIARAARSELKFDHLV